MTERIEHQTPRESMKPLIEDLLQGQKDAALLARSIQELGYGGAYLKTDIYPQNIRKPRGVYPVQWHIAYLNMIGRLSYYEGHISTGQRSDKWVSGLPKLAEPYEPGINATETGLTLFDRVANYGLDKFIRGRRNRIISALEFQKLQLSDSYYVEVAVNSLFKSEIERFKPGSMSVLGAMNSFAVGALRRAQESNSNT